jgi:SP family sugar:H+ symporter-like MFS transporter
MMGGAAWMAVCLFIYSFIGQYQLDHANPLSTPQAGNIMIVFTCLFIAAFATTWGPLVWAIGKSISSNPITITSRH